MDYFYQEANTFLGVNRIRPGELDPSLIKSFENYFDLTTRFYEP